MKKTLKLALIFTLVFFTTFSIQNKSYAASKKVMWGKVELKPGIIGKITVIKSATLWKRDSKNKLTAVRNLKSDEEYSVFRYDGLYGGQYGVDGGFWITKIPKQIKYETPPKSIAAALKAMQKEKPVIFNKITDQFPDPNLAKEIANLLGKSINDRITAKDITKVCDLYYLDLNDKNITNLKGLEVFEDLRNLWAMNNQLTSVDMKYLPKKLEYLILDNNNLTKIDITGLPNLIDIGLGKNKLTDLTLPALPKLQVLDLRDNKLTKLKLKGFPKLNRLFIPNNELTQLELSDLPKFSVLFANDNHLTNLTLKDFPNLTRFLLDNNNLNSLDTENLPNLQFYDAQNNKIKNIEVKNFPNLKQLVLEHNELSSIQVSGLLKLETLSIQDNNFTSLDVTNLPKLTILAAARNKLSHFPKNILELPSIKRIFLNQNVVDINSVDDLEIHKALLQKKLENYTNPFLVYDSPSL